MDGQCAIPPSPDFPSEKKISNQQQPITPSGLNGEKLSENIESIIQNHTVPAIGVAIVSPSGSETIVRGTRKLGSYTSVTINDTFMTGPVSSTLVPIVLACLVEKGLFFWSSTLEDLLPDILDQIHPAHYKTTLEMLSSHVSGITTKFPDIDGGQLSASLVSENISGYEGRRRTLSCLKVPPERVPGPGSSYRNAVNLMILAFVIETVTSESWEVILKREVFGPLGMEHTGIGQPDGLDDGELEHPTQPWPHEVDADGNISSPLHASQRNPWLTCPATYPALGVHSTLADLVIYLQFCLSESTPPHESIRSILSLAAQSRLYITTTGGDFTPGGFDTARVDWSEELVLRCKGHVSGFSTGIWIAPKTGFAFIIIVNVDGPFGAATRDQVYDLIA
jgi:CubicO group peptidase (beta-lactamase class C family)